MPSPRTSSPERRDLLSSVAERIDREHPVEGWPADVLLPLLNRTLDGDPAAIREMFVLVVAQCEKFDAARGRRETRDKVESWGDEIRYFDPPAAD